MRLYPAVYRSNGRHPVAHQQTLKLQITHINSYFITSSLHGELVAELDNLGVSQEVFVPVSTQSVVQKHLPPDLRIGAVHYFRCFTFFDRIFWPLKIKKIWSAFNRFVERHPPRLIHAHTLMVNGMIAYKANKKWGIPYIVTIRNTDFRVFLKRIPFFRLLALKILQRASEIIVVSPAYRDIHLCRFFPREDHPDIHQKCVVIPNGIHPFWVDRRERKKGIHQPMEIIFIGEVNKNKNLGSVISALELLTQRKLTVRLTVLGEGPLLSDFRKRKYAFPVQFHGHVGDREAVRVHLMESDILVVPSFTETFGLVYPESMSQGLPVIYSKDQGFDGHFPAGHIGYPVSPGDPEDIAEKILMVRNDFASLSEQAYLASSRFSWANVAGQLLETYGRVEGKGQKI